jgi:hypothetical protein
MIGLGFLWLYTLGGRRVPTPEPDAEPDPEEESEAAD